MNTALHHKVTPQHLTRKAFLYVRQSTLRQVFENTESTKRQYDLHKTAVSLGWSPEQIVVIDTDLGKSGASRDREGFQKLVAEVGLGNAGVVLSLEVSRLARNSGDWHQLLEICALTDTLIVDEAGVYDPSHFNDRLLLGLNGTMSEAELHVMRARLRGGLLNKARRGELETGLPAGFVYDSKGHAVLDPDKQVQDSIRLLFETFSRTGTAYATAMYFHDHSLRFPTRVHGGARHGELEWRALRPGRVVSVLHNPHYAGAFAYGRKQSRKRPTAPWTRRGLTRDQWHAFVLDAHPGYITWTEYEAHQARLRDTATAYGAERWHGPAREGPALLQGVLLCGVCGARMNVRYKRCRNTLLPYYACGRRAAQPSRSLCTFVPGSSLDAAVAQLLVASLTPAAVEIALDVEKEIRARIEQTDRLRTQQVDRARYEADVARRRYMQIDPDNRLVASSLEAEWNAALKVLDEAQQVLERQRQEDQVARDPAQRDTLLALSQRFSEVWHAATTPQRERKRMLRLIIDDITVHKERQVLLHVRFRGGAATTLTLPRPRPNCELRKTDASVVAEVDCLLDSRSYAEVAQVLNQRGRKSATGEPFSRVIVQCIVENYHLETFKERLRSAGMIGATELANKLGVNIQTIYSWQREGRIDGIRTNDKRERLYDPDTQPIINVMPGKPKSPRTAAVPRPMRSTPKGAV